MGFFHGHISTLRPQISKIEFDLVKFCYGYGILNIRQGILLISIIQKMNLSIYLADIKFQVLSDMVNFISYSYDSEQYVHL